MKFKYFHMLLGFKMDPPMGERSRGGRIEEAL